MGGGWKKIKVSEILLPLGITQKEHFISGNEAIVFGALAAGCRFYGGYPITPSSEILKDLSEYLPKVEGVFYQPEDEIASIGMIIGASLCGLKSMTATSGPGLSLMQEEIGWAIINETPIVIVDAMRIGPSTGQPTKPASADINAIINGRHGDCGNHIITLSPSSVPECFTMTVAAFNLAEQFRIPVILAIDGYLSHLSEKVILPEEIWVFDRIQGDGAPFGSNGEIADFIPVGYNHKVIYSGLIHDECGSRMSYSPETAEKLIWHLNQKQKNIIPKILEEKEKYSHLWEEFQLENAKYIIISYGATSRAARETVMRLRNRGKKVGLLALKMIWPLDKIFFMKAQRVKKIIMVEMNTGQLVDYIDKYFPRRKIELFNKWWGEAITTKELVDFCQEVIEQKKSKILEFIIQNFYCNLFNIFKELKRRVAISTPTAMPCKIATDTAIAIKKKYSFCPGCGHQSFSSIFLQAINELGLRTENTVFIAGIGCGGIVATTFGADVIKTSHGRTLNFARAVKLVRPDLNVIVISGDGDLINIGGNHLLHTANAKNRFPIVIFCLDNENYGMTGGQPSATTPETSITTIPFSQRPIDLQKFLYDGLEIDFFARSSIPELKEVVKKAINFQKGFAFVHVISPCTTYSANKNPGTFKKDTLQKICAVWERKKNED